MTLSIIICTYNRAHLLNKCLQSLVNQMLPLAEVIVVDNNSSDGTVGVVESYKSRIESLIYYKETNVGLSNARNAGYKLAKGDWVLYLDDDAIAFDDLVERALYLCTLGHYDCVGGMYYGYFESERPKWVNEGYGTKKLYSESLLLCPYHIPHGGIVLYRKSSLVKLNGFNSNFGMTANKIGYAEEVELQYRLEKNGGKVAFDPELKIFHLVKDTRLNLRNIIISCYQFGKGDRYREDLTFGKRLIKLIISAGAIPVYKVPKNLTKVLLNSNYYWQNMVIDTFSGTLYHLGRL